MPYPRYICTNPWCLDRTHLVPSCPHVLPPAYPARPLTPAERAGYAHLRRLRQDGALRTLPRRWGWWLLAGLVVFLALLIAF